jgi:uncharacterized protein (DUF362 family)
MRVVLYHNKDLKYCNTPPFHPSKHYPEYPFDDYCNENSVYHSIRNLFHSLQLDNDNFDNDSWNPLKDFIKPGNHVFIKPNLVYDKHEYIDALVTHGSIIRSVLDYVFIALKGKGKITIGDSPVQGANFQNIIEKNGLLEIVRFFERNSNIAIALLDLRKESVITDFLQKSILKRIKLGYKKSDYIPIDLKENSEFTEFDNQNVCYKISMYPREELKKHHTKNHHEYLIPQGVLSADVIINLPKLKTHALSGMTSSLKNLIGLNGDKNWVPHYRLGSRDEGGDEYLYKSTRKTIMSTIIEKIDSNDNTLILRALPFLYYFIRSTGYIIPFKDNYFYGQWYGNNTIPRSTLDLNKIIFYADKNGQMQNEIQRKMFVLVDAIIAGEGKGPLNPDPKECGILIASDNPLAADLVCSAIMGFDYKKIPTLKYATRIKNFKLYDGKENFEIISDRCKNLEEIYNNYNFNFKPADSWKGQIEYVK